MCIQVALFDLDGTLADSLPLIMHTYRRVFDEMGIPWINDNVMRWIGRPIVDIARHFAGGERAEEFIQRYQHHYHRDHDRYTRLFPGTLEMLHNLRTKGIQLGIVTSKGKTGAWRTVNFTGLDRYIDVMVTAHDVERHKPLPDPILKALEVLRVHSRKAVYVGDSHYDIQAGQAAGTVTLGVTWGATPREELERYQPDGLLESWADLKSFLEKANRNCR
ncbi:HAD family hydrolase [Desulfofundulus thermocisternus]|uniref:HAD family hydrolase n=1 Tax=Desulfofundulus thermocisternus TaxID=42471 RepID=UPI001A026C15|nr:HAD-IA family hydrolase [Desulfofundulus thermocisternus]MBE3586435.1 HAD-IA family hydrolase [Thermoanaerobacter sp.]MCS5696742.1 HAD-IA family hydrolase [Desulfofundulus thermocisternus]MDK2888697.1 pyrophosphatase PpaX [Thermoanaerobacter sp.]